MIKVIMTSATVFLNEVRFLSIVLLITSAYMLWLYFYWVRTCILQHITRIGEQQMQLCIEHAVPDS